MAGAIANTQKYWFIFPVCPLKSLLPPLVPVHRIVGMLQQVGTYRINKPVGLAFRLHEAPHPISSFKT